MLSLAESVALSAQCTRICAIREILAPMLRPTLSPSFGDRLNREIAKKHIENDIMISEFRRVSVAQFVVRNIEKEVKVRLQRRASRHGRSMEEEVRDILRNAVNEQDGAVGGLGTEIASLFAKVGLDDEIRELRGHETKPASFDR